MFILSSTSRLLFRNMDSYGAEENGDVGGAKHHTTSRVISMVSHQCHPQFATDRTSEKDINSIIRLKF